VSAAIGGAAATAHIVFEIARPQGNEPTGIDLITFSAPRSMNDTSFETPLVVKPSPELIATRVIQGRSLIRTLALRGGISPALAR
jgi:hypothetical protein